MGFFVIQTDLGTRVLVSHDQVRTVTELEDGTLWELVDGQTFRSTFGFGELLASLSGAQASQPPPDPAQRLVVARRR